MPRRAPMPSALLSANPRTSTSYKTARLNHSGSLPGAGNVDCSPAPGVDCAGTGRVMEGGPRVSGGAGVGFLAGGLPGAGEGGQVLVQPGRIGVRRARCTVNTCAG